MIRPKISDKMRKKYQALTREEALKKIAKVILEHKTELGYFETSELRTLEWLREQTRAEYDEYMKPIIERKPPRYIKDEEPETLLIRRINLEGRYHHLKRKITVFESFEGEIREWLKNKKRERFEKPSAFEEMFADNAIASGCLNVLKDVERPILNDQGEFIGRFKGAICVWVEEMQRLNLISHYSDRNIYAKLISKRLNPFTIDGSLFSKSNSRASDLYRLPIQVLLSQLAQKRR